MDRIVYATATLIGTIVGGGMFGIPYTWSKAGALPGLLILLGLGLVFGLIMLLYGEVVLRTRKEHRFIGYARKYLGKPGLIISSITIVFSFYTSLLGYLILGGQFAHLLLNPFLGGSVSTYSLIFFLLGSVIVAFGCKLVAKGELVMTALLLAVVSLLVFKGLPFINLEHLKSINLSQIFLPYGVALFALSGLAAIPELPSILKKDKKHLKTVIIIGTLTAVLVYGSFSLTVVGVSGQSTSPEALHGLAQAVPDHILQFGTFFGLLSVFTSLLIIGLNLTNSFHFDYGLNRKLSFILVFSLPLILFLAGWRNFIAIIGSAGAILGGFNCLLILLMHYKGKEKGNRQPEYSLKISTILAVFLMLIFIIGLIWQVMSV